MSHSPNRSRKANQPGPSTPENHRKEGGDINEYAGRTRSSHNNAPARVLLALLGAGDLHRRRCVLDSEETRRRVHMHHTFPFFYCVIDHGWFVRSDTCLDIPHRVNVQSVSVYACVGEVLRYRMYKDWTKGKDFWLVYVLGVESEL